MWVTRSSLRDHVLEVVVGTAVLANLTLMIALPWLATVPFHLIWIAVAVLFGFRDWGHRGADAVAAGVCMLTAAVFAWNAIAAGVETEEITEAPLMAVAFLVMVRFLRRKQARLELALAQVRSEHEARQLDQAQARRTGHDLRSPLSVARGHAELIKLRSKDPGIREDSDAVIAAVDRVVRITLRLRDLAARPDAGPV